jgi:XTP/dITP diphosphohydrolase
VLATLNQGKVREMQAALADTGVSLLGARDAGALGFPEESAPTYAGNALIKARYVAATTGRVALADDSGIEVDALGGAPGVRSARFGGPGLDDRARLHALLDAINQVPDGARGGRFVACLALVAPGGATRTFEADTHGTLLRAPRGEHGFGYDPIFLSNDLGVTFAEASLADKARVSHRGRALRALLAFLATPDAGPFLR